MAKNRPQSYSAAAQVQAAAELELRRRAEIQSFLQRYLFDTAAFAEDLINWGQISDRPAPYQLDVLGMTDKYDRVAVVGPRGLGKTAMASIKVLHRAICWQILISANLTGVTLNFPPGKQGFANAADWKIVTTASVSRQLTKFLWPEIHKMEGLLLWDKIPLPRFNQYQFLTTELKLQNGAAFAATSDNSDAIEGAHANLLDYLFDESKAIPDETWDASEGAFSNADPTKGKIATMLAISTPGEPEGRFFDIIERKSGYSDWETREVSLKETLKAGRISAVWVSDRKSQWGENDARYIRQVEGKFPTSANAGVIPRLWVMDAFERWNKRTAYYEEHGYPAATAVAADIGGEGEDPTLWAELLGTDYMTPLQEVKKVKRQNVLVAADAVIERVIRTPGISVTIDVTGVGAGTYAAIHKAKHNEPKSSDELDAYHALEHSHLDPFTAKAKPLDDFGDPRMDSGGLFAYRTRRAAAFFNLRDLLDPICNPTLCLPPSDELLKELTEPRYKELAGNVLDVESKQDLKKKDRVGNSTNHSDVATMLFDTEQGDPDGVGMFILQTAL